MKPTDTNIDTSDNHDHNGMIDCEGGQVEALGDPASLRAIHDLQDAVASIGEVWSERNPHRHTQGGFRYDSSSRDANSPAAGQLSAEFNRAQRRARKRGRK